MSFHASIPAKTMQEFIDYVKSRPDQVNYSSGGTGSVGHLSGALFASRAGVPGLPMDDDDRVVVESTLARLLLAAGEGGSLGNVARAAQDVATTPSTPPPAE